MFRLCSIFALCVWPIVALADLGGALQVVDGDTFDIGDTRVRLFGVDAPEAAQTCTVSDGQVWACGAWVTEQVRQGYQGAQADCTVLDTDRYGRAVVRCDVAGRDLGRALVQAGLATAYRDYSWDYDLDEKAAQLAQAGLWASQFQSPAAFRAALATPDPGPPGDCVIKGNISGNGHIYHRPGDPSYNNTRIDEARGERWFCTATEAEAAGWRAARG